MNYFQTPVKLSLKVRTLTLQMAFSLTVVFTEKITVDLYKGPQKQDVISLRSMHSLERTNWNDVTIAVSRESYRSCHKGMLQSRTKLLEKVFSIMSTFLRNKTISKTTPLRKEVLFPQFNVAFYKRPGIFFWMHNNIAFWGRWRGKNRYSYDEFRKMVPSIKFSQQFCPRL